jgi:hypothetical protein
LYNENNEIKGSQMGHTKKNIKKENNENDLPNVFFPIKYFSKIFEIQIMTDDIFRLSRHFIPIYF